MANFNDIIIDKEYPKVIKKLIRRAQLYEIETRILLDALKEESSILPLLPQDILNNLQDILKRVQTKTIMAYEIFEEQEKCDFDVEELEIFLKSKAIEKDTENGIEQCLN